MTIPTNMGLNTALSGLEASQAAIDTTGENISNANTTGYTEQVADATESGAVAVSGLNYNGQAVQIGAGVDVGSITRVRNQFLDVQYRTQNTQTSSANTLSTQLQQVQTAVNEPSSDGISSQLSAFWQAWGNLATNPASAAAQQTVVDAGQSLASTFNAVSSQMSTVQGQASQQYSALTGSQGQVEQDATQLASLNQQIVSAQANGEQANTLLDQRDNVLDDLSSLAQISVTNNSNGSVAVNFGDASSPLVGGSTGSTVTWPQTLTSASGGQLGALLGLSSSTGPIGTMMTSLDSVAGQVISSVNALQPSSPFFSGSSASTIAVSATTSTIQTSSSSTSGADLAQQIAGLQNGTADQSYAAFVSQVGNSVSSAQTSQSTEQAVLTAISNQRQSVSGVSLDQEMTNLVQYQQSYQASARMMNAMQSTIQDLLTAVQ